MLQEFDIDMKNSILVGDKNSDIEAGVKAGIKTNYLVTTGHTIYLNKFDVKILPNLKNLLKVRNQMKFSVLMSIYHKRKARIF